MKLMIKITVDHIATSSEANKDNSFNIANFSCVVLKSVTFTHTLQSMYS